MRLRLAYTWRGFLFWSLKTRESLLTLSLSAKRALYALRASFHSGSR